MRGHMPTNPLIGPKRHELMERTHAYEPEPKRHDPDERTHPDGSLHKGSILIMSSWTQ